LAECGFYAKETTHGQDSPNATNQNRNDQAIHQEDRSEILLSGQDIAGLPTPASLQAD
jgi:hypothetical protein